MVDEHVQQAQAAQYYNDLQKDYALLNSDFPESRVQKVVPNIIEEEIMMPLLVQKKDEKGEPLVDEKTKEPVWEKDESGNAKQALDANGIPQYVPIIAKVFRGYKIETFDVPMPKIFGTSLNTTRTNQFEVDWIRAEHRRYKANYIFAQKKGKKWDNYLHGILMGIESVVNTAKSRGGWAAMESKTTRTVGETKSYDYIMPPQNEQQKKKPLAKLLGGGATEP